VFSFRVTKACSILFVISCVRGDVYRMQQRFTPYAFADPALATHALLVGRSRSGGRAVLASEV